MELRSASILLSIDFVGVINIPVLYWCEIWYLRLREINLKVFKKVLGRNSFLS
jgi:hypothetical protein